VRRRGSCTRCAIIALVVVGLALVGLVVVLRALGQAIVSFLG